MRPLREPASSEGGHGPHTLRVWPGTVVGVYGDDVFVELGPRMQGVISVRQFESPPAIGEVFEFTLRGQEEGLWALSRREAPSLSTWEDMDAGSLVQARAVRVAPGGLEMKVGPLHGFMPKSHTGLPREVRPDVLVGKWLTCEVLEVDAERQRVLLSRKLVQQRERASEREREVGNLRLGQTVQGRVTRIEPYGAFVTFGHGLEGLVHVSNIAYERAASPSDVLRIGQPIEAQVLAVRDKGKRIALGIKQLQPSPWRNLGSRLAVGDVVEGSVRRVLPFGAFVAIERGVDGLVAASQCGLAQGELPASAVKAGQRVSVRVLALDPERERLSLSLLDPQGRRLEQDEAANRVSLAERKDASAAEPLATPLSRALRDALRGERGAPDSR